MKRAEMRELGAGGQVQKFDRLRQLQQRRCGEQEIVGQREDGADRAIGAVLISIVVGRLLGGFGGRLLRSRNGAVRIGKPGLKRRRGASDFPVEMPERQRKLDRKRKQRQPRALLEVFSEPVHDELRLPQAVSAANVIL